MKIYPTKFAVLNIMFLILLSITCTNTIAAGKEIKMAVLMPAPAKKIHANWQPLADYLAKTLGQPVKIVTPRGLKEAKDALATADFFYSNSYFFSLLSEDSKISAIAQMQNTGNSIYSRGKWLVRSDSKIKSAADLKGKTIALISPYGAGSYLAPRAYLKKQGLDIDNDVKVEFTSNLKKAAYMVMLGEADTAVMCEVNYEILSKKIDMGELNFFDRTDVFPEAVMFTPHDVNSDVVKRFQKALLEDTQERKVALKPLHGMKIGSFISFDPIVLTRISELRKEAGLKDASF